MKGTILGFQSTEGTGAIRGIDGKRYSFASTEWKVDRPPRAGAPVEFVATDGCAEGVYEISDRESKNNRQVWGVVSLLLTFFLGFIGTLISRLGIAELPARKVLAPVFAHLGITLLLFIPVLGWVIYIAGTLVFMTRNYQLVMSREAL